MGVAADRREGAIGGQAPLHHWGHASCGEGAAGVTRGCSHCCQGMRGGAREGKQGRLGGAATTCGGCDHGASTPCARPGGIYVHLAREFWPGPWPDLLARSVARPGPVLAGHGRHGPLPDRAMGRRISPRHGGGPARWRRRPGGGPALRHYKSAASPSPHTGRILIHSLAHPRAALLTRLSVSLSSPTRRNPNLASPSNLVTSPPAIRCGGDLCDSPPHPHPPAPAPHSSLASLSRSPRRNPNLASSPLRQIW